MSDAVEFELNATGNYIAQIESAIAATRALVKQTDTAEKSVEDLAKEKLNALERELDQAQQEARDLAKAAEEADQGFRDMVSTAAGNLLAKGLEKAAEAAKEFVKWIGESVVETEAARRASRGMLDVITGGQGERVFQGLSTLAKGLGGDVNELTKDFVSFVKDGLSEAEAVSLIKLKADVKAFTGSAELAEDAVADFNERIKAGESAADALAAVATAYRVVGDGSDAAAAKTKTLGGAIDNMKARIGDAFGKAIDNSGASLDKMGEALGRIASSEAFVGLIETAIDAAMVLASALADLVEWIDQTGEAGSSAATQLESIMGALRAVGAMIFGPFGAAIDNAIGAWNAFKAVIPSVVEGFSSALSSIKATVGQWVSAGADIINGLIDGIKSRISAAVASVSDLGDQAINALKSKLKISSPSKVFEGFGRNTVEGFEQGIEPVDVGALMFPDGPKAPANDAAPASAPAAPIVVNITVNGGSDAEATAAAVRREIDDYFSTMALGVGR